jgi:hypothetical protein
VNSDVPGGFTEATNFARLMAAHVPGARLLPIRYCARGRDWEDHRPRQSRRLATHLVGGPSGRGYPAETSPGLVAHVVSLETLRWREGHAYIDDAGFAAIGTVVRFYQVRWLAQLLKDGPWTCLFLGGKTPVANPGRDRKQTPSPGLGRSSCDPTDVAAPAPETRDPRDAPG